MTEAVAEEGIGAGERSRRVEGPGGGEGGSAPGECWNMSGAACWDQVVISSARKRGVVWEKARAESELAIIVKWCNIFRWMPLGGFLSFPKLSLDDYVRSWQTIYQNVHVTR